MDNVKKLNTIQKENKLNYVYAVGEKENGGAYHTYRIHKSDSNEYEDYIGKIAFQKGARNDSGSEEGVIDTDLLEVVRHRLQCFQEGEYATEENDKALSHVELALIWLDRRVKDRADRDVLGTTEK